MKTNQWPIAALLFICLARLWLVPLSSSYWVDELVTVFVTRYPAHASFAVAPQVPQSIYYWLPRTVVALFGSSEISFRISSVIAMGLALWVIALLAARLIHPRAGWFAVFAALSLRGIDYFAIDARPYALGILTASACLYFLVRWLDTASWGNAVAFAVFAALVWRVHLLFWPLYLVIAIYAGVRLVRGASPVRWPQWTVTFAATGALLLPQAISALSLAKGAQSHAFAQMPTLHVFEHELHWNVPVLCGVAMWLLSRFARPRFVVAPSAWVLILGWWLIQPVVLFLYSHVTGNSVYVGRYISLLLPGAALTATAAVAYWMPADKWRVAAAVMAVAALISQGHWGGLLYRHDISDWRSAQEEVNRFADASTPVIVQSPFIEARPTAWTPDYPLPGFLYAHLEGYPIAGKPYLFPYDGPARSSEAVRYADDLLSDGRLLSAGKWAIYGQIPGSDWDTWFAARPELGGWNHTLKKFGDVQVVEFSNSGTTSTQPR